MHYQLKDKPVCDYQRKFSRDILPRLIESVRPRAIITAYLPGLSYLISSSTYLLLNEFFQRLVHLVCFLRLHEMSRVHLLHYQILHPWPHQPLLHLRHRNIIPRTRHQQRRHLDMVSLLRHLCLVCRVQVGDLRFVPVKRGPVAAVFGGEDFVVDGDFFRG